MKEAQLLSPLSESHSCFLEEETLNRPLACSAVLTEFSQGFWSAVFANTAFATLNARASEGCGNWSGIDSTAFN